MDSQYSILILQKIGSSIDWMTVEHYGPFASQEEREKWESGNPIEEYGRNYRYLTVFLSK